MVYCQELEQSLYGSYTRISREHSAFWELHPIADAVASCVGRHTHGISQVHMSGHTVMDLLPNFRKDRDTF